MDYSVRQVQFDVALADSLEIPHAHQWWGKDSSGKRVLVREPGTFLYHVLLHLIVSHLLAGADHRTATAQELFYDLVFVAVIASLGTRYTMTAPRYTNAVVHLLAHNVHLVFNFIVMFLFVYRVWNSQLFYATSFDQQEMVYSVMYFTVMPNAHTDRGIAFGHLYKYLGC